ncbi:hypothetical protein VYU27_009848, partial [Nannochloropsis oceanica]
GATEGSTHLRSPSLTQALLDILVSLPALNPNVLARAAGLVSDIIGSDPSVVSYVLGSGLAQALFALFSTSLPPSSEFVREVPTVLGSLTITNSGLASLLAANPFPSLFSALTSPLHVLPYSRAVLPPSTPELIGQRLEDLLQTHAAEGPSGSDTPGQRLRDATLNAALSILSSLITPSLPSRRFSPEEGGQEEGEEEGTRARYAYLQYIGNMAHMLASGVLAKSDHCARFLERDGMTILASHYFRVLPLTGTALFAHFSCGSNPTLIQYLGHAPTTAALSLLVKVLAQHDPLRLLGRLLPLISAALHDLEQDRASLLQAAESVKNLEQRRSTRTATGGREEGGKDGIVSSPGGSSRHVRRSTRRRSSSLSGRATVDGERPLATAVDEAEEDAEGGGGKSAGKGKEKKRLTFRSSGPPSSPPSPSPSVLATGLLSLLPNVPLHVAARRGKYLSTGEDEEGKEEEGGREGGDEDKEELQHAQQQLLEAQGMYLRRILLIDWLVGWLAVVLKGTHPRSSSQPLRGWSVVMEKGGLETLRRLKALHQSALLEVTAARVSSLHKLPCIAANAEEEGRKEGGKEGGEESAFLALADRFPPPATYTLRVVREEGAMVRDGPEPSESNRVRVLEAGSILTATQRQSTAQGLMAYHTRLGWVLGATDSCISSLYAHHHSHHSRLSSGYKDDAKSGSVEVLAMAMRDGKEVVAREDEEEMTQAERLRVRRRQAAAAVATMRLTGGAILGRLQQSFKNVLTVLSRGIASAAVRWSSRGGAGTTARTVA